MNRSTNKRTTGRAARATTALVALGALTGFASGGTAWAGGNGAQAQTFNVHGTAAFGIDELDLNQNSPNPPPPGIVAPAGCWLGTDNGILSTDGNVIFHQIDNKTGGWFTTTYTGQAEVFPLVEVDAVPQVDPNTQNDEVDTSAPPIASGHLTTWFGDEDNNRNEVTHATVHFRGTDNSGNPVDLFAQFQLGTNANGQMTVENASITC